MPCDSIVQVVLLRSGRTEWDDQCRVQGRTDLPLSEGGRKRVNQLIAETSATLRANPPAIVFTGPDEASRESAAVLADAVGSKTRTLPELESMDLGLWEGLLESEIEHRYPSACRLWQDQPSLIHPPKGETFVDAEARIRSALAPILEKANGKPMAFVARPLPYAMAACWLTGRPACDIWKIIEDGPDVQILGIDRPRLRQLCEELKAGA